MAQRPYTPDNIRQHPGFPQLKRHVALVRGGSKKAHLLGYLGDERVHEHPANYVLTHLTEQRLEFYPHESVCRDRDKVHWLVSLPAPVIDAPRFIADRPAYEFYDQSLLPTLTTLLPWDPQSDVYQGYYERPRLPRETWVRVTNLYFQTQDSGIDKLGDSIRPGMDDPRSADEINNEMVADSIISREQMQRYLFLDDIHHSPWALGPLSSDLVYSFPTLSFAPTNLFMTALDYHAGGPFPDHILRRTSNFIPTMFLVVATKPVKLLPVYIGCRFDSKRIARLKENLQQGLSGERFAPGFQIW